MSERYTAAVCMKGHTASTALEIGSGTVGKFCSTCGAPIIRACPNCSMRLLGTYRGVVDFGYRPDTFCSNCGAPHPWADREAIVGHLQNLLLYGNHLDHAEQLEVIEKLAVLATPDESEKARVSAGDRIRTLVPKAWNAAIPVLQSVLSAEIQSKLGLPR